MNTPSTQTNVPCPPTRLVHIPSQRWLDAQLVQRTEGNGTLLILQEHVSLEGKMLTLYTPLYRQGSSFDAWRQDGTRALYAQSLADGGNVRYKPFREYQATFAASLPVFSNSLDAMIAYARDQARQLTEFLLEPTQTLPALHPRVPHHTALTTALLTGHRSLKTLADPFIPQVFGEVMRYVRATPRLSRAIYQHLLAIQEFADEAGGTSAIMSALLELGNDHLGAGLAVGALRAGLERIFPTIQAWRLLEQVHSEPAQTQA